MNPGLFGTAVGLTFGARLWKASANLSKSSPPLFSGGSASVTLLLCTFFGALLQKKVDGN